MKLGLLLNGLENMFWHPPSPIPANQEDIKTTLNREIKVNNVDTDLKKLYGGTGRH